MVQLLFVADVLTLSPNVYSCQALNPTCTKNFHTVVSFLSPTTTDKRSSGPIRLNLFSIANIHHNPRGAAVPFLQILQVLVRLLFCALELFAAGSRAACSGAGSFLQKLQSGAQLARGRAAQQGRSLPSIPRHARGGAGSTGAAGRGRGPGEARGGQQAGRTAHRVEDAASRRVGGPDAVGIGGRVVALGGIGGASWRLVAGIGGSAWR